MFIDAINTLDQVVVALTTLLQDVRPALEFIAPIVELVGVALESVGEGIEPYCPLIADIVALGAGLA